MSDKVETAPLAVRRDRSVASRRPARQARTRRDRRIIENRGVSVAEIAEREDVVEKPTRDPAGQTARSDEAPPARPEMAPQGLEKIESGPGIGMGSDASDPQYLVHGRAADRTRLRLPSRKNDEVAKWTSGQKKAPEALKSLDAELKSAPVAAGNGGARLVRGGSAPRLGAADRRPSALSGAGKKEGPRDGEGNFPGCKALKSHKTGMESRLAVQSSSASPPRCRTPPRSRRSPFRRGETPAPQAKPATPTRRASIELTKRRKR